MTTLVAVRKHDEIVIAADSLTTFGDLKLSSVLRPQSREDRPLPRHLRRALRLGRAPARVREPAQDARRPRLLEPARDLRDAAQAPPGAQGPALPQPEGGGGRSLRVDADHRAVTNEHGIFGIYSMREVFEYTKFWAAGSGRDVALGAMYALYPRLKTADGHRARRRRGRRDVRPQLVAAAVALRREGEALANHAMADTLVPFVVEGAGVRGAVARVDATVAARWPRTAIPPPLQARAGRARDRDRAARREPQVQRRAHRAARRPRPGAPRGRRVHRRARRCARRRSGTTTPSRASAPRRRSPSSRANRGAARLAITVDPRDGAPFQGIVAIEPGSVASMIGGYLERSAQVESRLVLAARRRAARRRAGPAACPRRKATIPTPGTPSPAPPMRSIRRCCSARTTRTRRSARSPASATPRVFAAREPRFACRCSPARAARAIAIAGARRDRGGARRARRRRDHLRVLRPTLHLHGRAGARHRAPVDEGPRRASPSRRKAGQRQVREETFRSGWTSGCGPRAPTRRARWRSRRSRRARCASAANASSPRAP